MFDNDCISIREPSVISFHVHRCSGVCSLLVITKLGNLVFKVSWLPLHLPLGFNQNITNANSIFIQEEMKLRQKNTVHLTVKFLRVWMSSFLIILGCSSFHPVALYCQCEREMLSVEPELWGKEVVLVCGCTVHAFPWQSLYFKALMWFSNTIKCSWFSVYPFSALQHI